MCGRLLIAPTVIKTMFTSILDNQSVNVKNVINNYYTARDSAMVITIALLHSSTTPRMTGGIL